MERTSGFLEITWKLQGDLSWRIPHPKETKERLTVEVSKRKMISTNLVSETKILLTRFDKLVK